MGHRRDRRGRARSCSRRCVAEQRPGRYQIEAAIAALHDDAASAEETDWPQILEWYDDLVALSDDPVREDPAAVLERAVAVGHVLGAARRAARDRPGARGARRSAAVARRPRLPVRAGRRLPRRRGAYAEAARLATNVAERDHLVRQAARARAAEPARNVHPGAGILSWCRTTRRSTRAPPPTTDAGRPAYSPQLEAVLTEELGLDGSGQAPRRRLRSRHPHRPTRPPVRGGGRARPRRRRCSPKVAASPRSGASRTSAGCEPGPRTCLRRRRGRTDWSPSASPSTGRTRPAWPRPCTTCWSRAAPWP